jgi:hypothetical protein
MPSLTDRLTKEQRLQLLELEERVQMWRELLNKLLVNIDGLITALDDSLGRGTFLSFLSRSPNIAPCDHASRIARLTQVTTVLRSSRRHIRNWAERAERDSDLVRANSVLRSSIYANTYLAGEKVCNRE